MYWGIVLLLVGSGTWLVLSLFQATINNIDEGLPVFSNLINDVTTIAEYVYYYFIFSNFTVFCEGITDDPTAALPHILEFGDLHYTDAFKAMITALKGVAGVYAIIHTASGKTYIGSSMNIGLRLMSHLVYGSCNPHLQNALALYGLSAFVVRLVEEYIFDPNLTDEENAARLLALEQRWLDWLFRLSPSLRYNFNPIAYTPPSRLGEKHSLESREKMSAAKTGEKHPNYGKTPSEETRSKMSAAQAGNPSANRVGVSLFDLEGNLIQSFSSQTAAAEYLGVTRAAVSIAIERNSVVKRLYRVSSRS